MRHKEVLETILDSTEFFESPMIYLPNTHLKITGLREGSKYVIVGVAKDGSRLAYGQPQFATTLNQENVSHLNQGDSPSFFCFIAINSFCLESLRNAAWFVAVLCAVAIALITILITCCCEERRGGNYSVRRKVSFFFEPV